MLRTHARSFLMVVQLVALQLVAVAVPGQAPQDEHGLKYGTALDAAELSKKPEVVALLKKAEP